MSAVEYQMQVEQAVDTLKAELSTLFEKDISYDIYTKDVYFQDPVNKFKGKINIALSFGLCDSTGSYSLARFTSTCTT